MKLSGSIKYLILIALPVWATLVLFGGGILVRYSARAGEIGNPPTHWPSSSAIPQPNGQPVLTMFVHPHCPCSRASLAILARILAQFPNSVRTHIAFVIPTDFTEDWAKTTLWENASQIPGVIVSFDPTGTEATRFGAATSGQTQLYDGNGKLVFSGGITTARGHEGDNAGADAILTYLLTSRPVTSNTPVFGCQLFGKTKSESSIRPKCPECNR